MNKRLTYRANGEKGKTLNDLTIFTYGETPVRTIQKDEQIWWVLSDVCKVLELTNPTVIASRLDEDERAKSDLGRQGSGWIINEAGLYSVILRSDKPEAKAFKRWVTHEVLPTIRKNGSYGTPDEKLEVARLIASCTNETAVKGILSLYGVSISKDESTYPAVKSPSDSASAYLNTVEPWELTEVPCKKVYSDYLLFCIESHYAPFALSGFSKSLRKYRGLTVRRHRVNGILTGFYT